ncbi:MAG TPA: hypothetical protein VLG12_08525 [Candidatus Saccharimonadales bacterium]|nr:hypothetical protein [Candidatus Saccharimonadales bacterium]
MKNTPHHLFTALEIEEEFGKKYFYRQRIYRLADAKKIHVFQLRGKTCYLGTHVLQAFVKDLELKIAQQFPELSIDTLQIFYDLSKGKKMVVDGLFGRGISVNTDEETEEDLLKKINGILEWIGNSPLEILSKSETLPSENKERNNALIEESADLALVPNSLPEEIFWMKVDVNKIEGVDIKSYFLVSLPSIAQFIGIRPDKLVVWFSNTTFIDSVLSAHYKQLQGTQIRVPWKRGVKTGYTPFVPFELIPEIIVAFRQSGRTVSYPEKAQSLYELAQNTLQAVGLAVSGNKDKAAEELAKVGKKMGLSVAEQIIAIFKQYESKDYQIQTNKEFNSKVKQMGMNYAVMTGTLTFGITGRYVSTWKAFGTSRKLSKSYSSREIMRKLAPGDSVGMTFGEKDFIKNENVEEAINTGKQGKNFYNRLKQVGLLDD